MFEVLSTSGDTHLGGDDFDRRIVDSLADEFQKNEGVDLRQDRQALQRLTEAAEKAKASAQGFNHNLKTLIRSTCCGICVTPGFRDLVGLGQSKVVVQVFVSMSFTEPCVASMEVEFEQNWGNECHFFATMRGM